MKQAKTLSEILKVTSNKPLIGEDHDHFFVETDAARGRASAEILTQYLLTLKDQPQRILFTGHTGSGKSTELWRLQQKLSKQYLTIHFSVEKHLNLLEMNVIDLIFLIMEQIYAKAIAEGIGLKERLLTDILHWLEDTTEIRTDELKAGVEVEAGAGIPKLLSALFIRVKGILQKSTATKVEIRRKIEPRISQLIDRCNLLLEAINDNLKDRGQRTLVIVEDLDKLQIKLAKELFHENSLLLTGLETHTIYTVPIFMLYSRDISILRKGFGHKEVLPMIKIRNKNSNKLNPIALDTIKKILKLRITESILHEDAIQVLVEKSGGCLRDIFDMLQNGTLTGLLQKKNAFDRELALEGANEVKKFYEMALAESKEGDIKPEQYFEKLSQIYYSKTKKIAADPISLDLMHSQALLEYNGDRWCDVHPLVVDFMKEMGYLKSGQKIWLIRISLPLKN